METLKIDGEVVLVSSLPDELKQLVTLYEYALEEELDAQAEAAAQAVEPPTDDESQE
jgi:hypothetical protein